MTGTFWMGANVAQGLVVGAYAFNFAGNLFFGRDISKQSARWHTMLTPPGWAFGIWGIIFSWEALGCTYLALPQNRTLPLLKDPVWLFSWVTACVAQSVWPKAFSKSSTVSCSLLVTLWASMVTMVLRSAAHMSNISASSQQKSPSEMAVLYLMGHAPFAFHLGWLTAAATLNAQIVTVDYKMAPSTVLAVALHSLVFIVGGTWTLAILKGEVFQGAAACWALFAISKHIVRPVETSEGPTEFPAVVYDGIRTAASWAFRIMATLTAVRAGSGAMSFFGGESFPQLFGVVKGLTS